MVEIKNKKGGTIFTSSSALTLGEAVEEAVRRKVSLSEADLRFADLSHRDLSWGDFIRADLSGAFLSGTNLSLARLDYANLSGANLFRSNLSCSICYGARFDRANLVEADLTGASLTAAILSEAQLTRTKLKGACLERAVGDGERIVTLRMDKVHLVATRQRVWLNCTELGTEEFLGEISYKRFSDEVASFLSSYYEHIAKILKKKFDLG